MDKIKHAFDEMDAAKNIFERKEGVSATINAQYRNDSISDVLHFVALYLLYGDCLPHEDSQLDKTKKVIDLVKKWNIVSLYLYIQTSDKFHLKKIKEFEQFESGIDVNTLKNLKVDGDDLMIKLFNHDPIKSINKEIDKAITLANKNETKKSDVEALKKFKKNIKLIITTNFNYFSFKSELSYFKDNKEFSKVDTIVCRCLHNPINKAFDFKICDESKANFNKMVKKVNDVSNPEFISELYLGIIFDRLICENNLKPKTLNYRKNRVKLKLLSKDFTAHKYLDFLKLKGPSKDISFDYDKVIDFEFLYNGDKYSFSKDGIIKIG